MANDNKPQQGPVTNAGKNATDNMPAHNPNPKGENLSTTPASTVGQQIHTGEAKKDEGKDVAQRVTEAVDKSKVHAPADAKMHRLEDEQKAVEQKKKDDVKAEVKQEVKTEAKAETAKPPAAKQSQIKEGLKVKGDIKVLLKETEKLEYSVDAGNIEMASNLMDRQDIPEIKKAAEELAKERKQTILRIMVHRVEPNAEVPKHRDFVPATAQGSQPCLERWHLPLQTSDQCTWWDEEAGEKKMPVGVWSGPVPYWLNHTIYNKGKEKRVHVIVDLDSPKAIGNYSEQNKNE